MRPSVYEIYRYKHEGELPIHKARGFLCYMHVSCVLYHDDPLPKSRTIPEGLYDFYLLHARNLDNGI